MAYGGSRISSDPVIGKCDCPTPSPGGLFNRDIACDMCLGDLKGEEVFTLKCHKHSLCLECFETEWAIRLDRKCPSCDGDSAFQPIRPRRVRRAIRERPNVHNGVVTTNKKKGRSQSDVHERPTTIAVVDMRPKSHVQMRERPRSDIVALRRFSELDELTPPRCGVSLTGTLPFSKIERASFIPKGIVYLPHAHASIWPTQKKNVIAIGGANRPCITIVSGDNGGTVMFSQDLPIEATYINDGLHIINSDHLIIARTSTHQFKIFVVKIDLTPGRLKVKSVIPINKPSRVFHIDNYTFGIFSHETYPVYRIGLYSRSNQKLMSTVDIRYSDGSSNDVVLPLDCGEFLVSSHRSGVVHHFSSCGDHLQTLGTPGVNKYCDVPGLLYKPRYLYRDKEDGICVVCEDGSVHQYVNQSWTLLQGLDDGVWAAFKKEFLCVVTGKILSIYDSKL